MCKLFAKPFEAVTRLSKAAATLSLALFLVGCGDNLAVQNPIGPSAPPVTAGETLFRWNNIAVDASGFDHTVGGAGEQKGPTKASRAMAIVHVAMHDSVQAVQRRYQTFLPQAPASSNTSLDAAVAQAAHDTLVALFPSQSVSFDAKLLADLNALPSGGARDEGIAVGQRAAAAILANRANDGSDPVSQATPAYVPGTQPGQWRPDPINPGQTAFGANWSKVRPFVLTSSSQFRIPPPPALNSPEYTEAFNEVARLGGDGVTSPTVRTQAQTNIGIFWAYDGTPSLCAPPRLYNQVVQTIARQQGISEPGDLARLLALENLAQADAGIASWESKYFYNFWRPVTGIREADAGTGPSGLGDGNASTQGIANFLPLCAPASNLNGPNFTPPFPAYPSGHATFGGAVFQVLRNQLGKDVSPFQFTSDEYNGVTKDNTGALRPLIPMSFASFTQAEEENGQSRIYLGIHWKFDKVQGIAQGNQVADFVMANSLRRLP